MSEKIKPIFIYNTSSSGCLRKIFLLSNRYGSLVHFGAFQLHVMFIFKSMVLYVNELFSICFFDVCLVYISSCIEAFSQIRNKGGALHPEKFFSTPGKMCWT